MSMSPLGQTEKNSLRANVFRVTPESGHCSMQSVCLKGANNGHVATASTGPKCWRPHVLASPTTEGMAAIGSTMPAAPAVPPAPAVPSHLDQLTLLRHRLGSCGQRSDRGSDSRYAEQHRTNHKKRCRNFELRHDIPPIRNFRP